MTNTAINTIKALAEKTCGGVFFDCDRADLMNIKVDKIRRGKPFIWAEEPDEGRIYSHKRPAQIYYPIRIYFCAFENFENTGYDGDMPFESKAETRLEIIERLEDALVIPFLNEFLKLDIMRRNPNYLEYLHITYPPSMFDGNEVSVCVELPFIEEVCPLPFNVISFDVTQWEECGGFTLYAFGIEVFDICKGIGRVRLPLNTGCVWECVPLLGDEYKTQSGKVTATEAEGGVCVEIPLEKVE